MGIDLTVVTRIVGTVIYCALGLIALWGAFLVIMIWRRVAQSRFRNEEEQEEFLDELEQGLQAGDYAAVEELCEGDPRAVPALALLALANRKLGLAKMRTLLADRFQRDVLADLEYRLSWVYTVIKSAPMLGLLGTVMGMMGAFSQLAVGERVDPSQLADDISLALITTAIGLAIAIPLVLCTASINVRIRRMEDLVGAGIARLLEMLRTVSARPAETPRGREPAEAVESS
ncbi:MAG TPA: MotA/TolQ/ExbB proton channel family protein [Planctomycetes bacterium]|nr:MotA/TolQ/ExbB proton channel family protein [Planctomycetota bacterium]